MKTIAAVDTEKLGSILEFVDYSVTPNRVEQAIQQVYGDEVLDNTKLGDFLRWIIKDIMTEEIDTFTDSKLEPKDVNKYISTRAREMFFKIQANEF